MEQLVVGVAVEDGVVEMVGERLPLFLGVGVESKVEKMRILLFALRKSRFFLQITLQGPLMSF